MIKIALVDDHIAIRKSLAMLVATLEDIEIIFEADNGMHCLEQLKKHPTPDIILLDITMPLMGGVQTASMLKHLYPRVKIIALTMISCEQVILLMIKNGARGYLLKDCETTDLQNALQTVYTEGYYYNHLLTRKLVRTGLPPANTLLNERELIFLKWACTELNHKQIAEKMCVSHRTIDGYRDSIFGKLNINSRVALVIYAIKNGLVQF